jgi:dipeptidyl-peptidase-4
MAGCRVRTLGALVLVLAVSATSAETPSGETNLSEETNPSQLSIDLLFTDGAHGASVEEVAWRPGERRTGGELLGRWDDGSGDAWWLFRSDGSKSLLFRPQDLGVSRADDVGRLAWSDDGTSLLIELERRVVLWDIASGKARQLVDGEARNPRLAPDGKRLSFVRYGDLFVQDIGSGEMRRLTEDGEPGVVLNGVTDWVYWEEIWDRTEVGQWWSGDSRYLAYYHFDDSGVATYPLVDTGPLHPVLERQRYPKAGDDLPRVEVRVVDLESGERVLLRTGDNPDAYLVRVHWHDDGKQLVVERLNREQTRLDLLLCSAADGSCRVLATQQEETGVNLGAEFVFLDDGRFLWSSEESGWRQLYLYAADGGKRQKLTPDGWALTELNAVDEAGETFVFTAYSADSLGAAERHIFQGRLDGGEARRLTEKKGWHEALVSPAGHWLHRRSAADSWPQKLLSHLDRPGFSRPLPSRPPVYDVSALPQWEFFTIPGPGGVQLPAQLLKPSGFDPGRRYPVLMYHYGGPGSQVVEDAWKVGRLRYLWHRLMAERGYVVFAVDNEASRFFGKRGEDKLHRHFGEVELAGQLAGVKYLKAQPWVEGDSIGLWGWSGGGSHTLYSLFKRPGVWKAGVSGAPVTDWRYYDAIWMERYLDRPQDNEEGYEISAPLAYAGNLADALLVIHGTADNNVHPQNTLNLADALVKAGKPFEMALYPGARHSLETFKDHGQRHVFERIMEFFDRHLAVLPSSSGTLRAGLLPEADLANRKK